ncbi:MAG: hypothetical protein RIS47_834 [Bacteroidota bacterium]|jgi:RNA polymerase sigma-70 factor (ECF subfamily)
MDVNPNLSENAKRDYKLVESAKAGEQRSYAALLDYYRDTIYYMLLKMVNNKSDAEDLTIEAFGKAFKNLHLYTPTYAFSTWLFKIASNNGIDFLRSRRVKQRYVSIDTEHDDEINKAVVRLKSENKDPEESMIKEQKEKLMRLVVRKLNPNYRNIITMRYFDEMSYVEIAEKLDLPLGTVKARLHRSRELLANILKTSTDLDD